MTGATRSPSSILSGRRSDVSSVRRCPRSREDLPGQPDAERLRWFGRLTRWTGPAGDTTTVEYDTEGNPLHIVLADGGNIYRTYDTIGNLVSLIDGAGRTTRNRYGTCHRLLEMTDPSGKITRFEGERSRIASSGS